MATDKDVTQTDNIAEMKIYIATPVNARKEGTLKEKRLAAWMRVCYLKVEIAHKITDAEVHSSFDSNIAPIGEPLQYLNEAIIMGKCVTCVMKCDAILMDWGYENSKGCTVEHTTALTYGKKIIHAYDLNIEPE